MNSLTAGVFAAIWLSITIPTANVDTLNIEEVITIPVKATDDAEVKLCESEFDLLCRCVEAEAGDQGYLGKVYVVDCILNRCDAWNKSVTGIIYQKHQFEVVSNNRINTVPVTAETRQAVSDELRKRTNYEILHFRMSRYHSFGTPLFRYKDHYFSK